MSNYKDHLWEEIDEYCEANGIDDSFQYAIDRCGKMQDGFCTKVATEYCDWECPFEVGEPESQKENQG